MSFISGFDFFTSVPSSSINSPRIRETKKNELEDTFFVFEESSAGELE